jgi:hypothetical protein
MLQKPNQTTENQNSVSEFLDKIEEERKRKDAFAFLEVFTKSRGPQPNRWRPPLFGNVSYHIINDIGRNGDAPLAPLSPQKNGFSLYLSTPFMEWDSLLKKFGKHITYKAYIYEKQFWTIDSEVLSEMLKCSVAYIKSIYPKQQNLNLFGFETP